MLHHLRRLALVALFAVPGLSAGAFTRHLWAASFAQDTPVPEAAAAALEPAPVDRSTAEAARELNLYTIPLAAGDHPSINIDWFRNGAQELRSAEWLSKGYDGVRFQGEGIEATHLRCTSWDGITIAVRQHEGVVEFRDLTIHAGYDRGTAFGEQNTPEAQAARGRPLSPRFQARLVNVRAVVEPPSAYGGKRPKWLVFGYQVDLFMSRVELDATEAVEHAVYLHGFARRGAYLDRVDFQGSGAEGFKVRSDATETVWAGPNQWIILRGCTFRDWFQPWSWRGGGGVVLQGTGANVLLERCAFYGGTSIGTVTAYQRSKAVMVSSEGESWDAVTGALGTGFGNGSVTLRECAMFGGPGPDWYSSIARCARNGGSQLSARSFRLERCAVWGRRMNVQISDLPAGGFEAVGCNTPELREWSEAHGMDTSAEAVFLTSQRAVPLSEGFRR